MRVDRLVGIGIWLALCCILYGCRKENNPPIEDNKGSVYGTVTYLATGDPVANAIVQLQPRNLLINGATRQTGYDGYYEFCDVEDGTYSIIVSKTGYDDMIGDYDIKISNGCQIRKDVQIEKLPVVYTYDATDLLSGQPYSVTLNGYVASEGSPVYVERGFYYGFNDQTKVPVPGNGTGAFSTTVTVWYRFDWYKAYIVSSSGQYIYGESVFVGWE